MPFVQCRFDEASGLSLTIHTFFRCLFHRHSRPSHLQSKICPSCLNLLLPRPKPFLSPPFHRLQSGNAASVVENGARNSSEDALAIEKEGVGAGNFVDNGLETFRLLAKNKRGWRVADVAGEQMTAAWECCGNTQKEPKLQQRCRQNNLHVQR